MKPLRISAVHPRGPIGALFGAPTGDQGITADAPSALRSVWLQARYNF